MRLIHIYKVFLSAVFLLLLCGYCNAEDIAVLPEFKPEDRILVFAPHPDDEAIGTGGVLQRAIQLKLPVKIAYYTNGDNNEFAFIVYEKRIVIKQRAFVHMGELRRKEAIQAMKFLGLSEDQLIFLGYPDFGTMKIFTRYWGDTRPFRSMLTRVREVPYKESLSYDAPYTGESILRDLKTILLSFKPTKIFVTLPVDTNVDHRSIFLFLQVALWDLKGVIPEAQVFPYLIHRVGWPRPRGFHPELSLDPPADLANSQISWYKLELSADEINKKKEAISFYRTQIECAPAYLYTFARKNELFGRYPVIVLKDSEADIIDWSSIEKIIPIESSVVEEDDEDSEYIDYIYYAKKEAYLYIKMRLHNFMSKTRGIDIYLCGYRKDIPFGQMPKIRVHLGWKSSVTIFDKLKRIFVSSAKFHFEGKDLVVKFPLAGLKFPEYILSSASSKAGDLPYDNTAWRILKIE